VTTFRERSRPVVKSQGGSPTDARRIFGTIVGITRSVQHTDIEITERKGERT
jgi:hypothetical protein